MRHESKIPDQPGWLVVTVGDWLSRLFFYLVNTFPRVRKFAYGALFDLISAVTSKLSSVTMMNYGFAGLNDHVKPIELERSEESERYCLQLYDRVAGAVSLLGLDVLDVSCGRGGGSAYILRHLGARHVTGLDFCHRSIKFCRRVHSDTGLRFVHGQAEALPFADEQFDAAVNIESSFCYSDMDKFLFELCRVLKPGGYFAFADLRLEREIDELLYSFKCSEFKILEKDDITQNVRKALELDSAERARKVRRFVLRPLRSILRIYAGVQGTRIPNLLERGEMVYLRLLLRKAKSEGARS